jgi:Transglycosylase SLT domain
MPRSVGSLVACLLAVGCRGGTAPPSSVPAPTAPIPPTASPIPARPDRLAADLETVSGDLEGSIDAWKASGGTSTWPPPTPLVLDALAQQRIYGTLAGDLRLLHDVLRHLPLGLRAEARSNAAAGAELLSIVSSGHPAPTFRTRAPPPADTLLGYYRLAERRFGVAWQVLAAVNFIESKFGRVVSASSAGAQGPMQFIAATWRAYGLGGDVHDPRDAILGAANYLHASGAPGDERGALFHYNPSRAYVRAVMLYAGQMKRDPRSFYAYYNWQVFVRTSSGVRQLTGPGS